MEEKDEEIKQKETVAHGEASVKGIKKCSEGRAERGRQERKVYKYRGGDYPIHLPPVYQLTAAEGARRNDC